MNKAKLHAGQWRSDRARLAQSWLVGVALCTTMLLGWMAHAMAQGLAVIPALTGHVIDTTATLDASQTQVLDDKLKQFEQQKGTQIVVLMVPSTAPEDIASYANRVGNAWKIGRKDIGDGLLLVVAKSDRTVRIEVAKTLEGAIPDLAAKRIIDGAITPNFKAGQFAAGLDAATSQMMGLVSGEALPEPVAVSSRAVKNMGFQWTDLAIFLFFAVVVGGRIARSVLGGKFGALVTGGAVGAMALFVTASLLLAGGAALVALVVTLLMGNARLGNGALGALGGLSERHGGHGSLGGGGWSGGSGGGGGFSSGGGGNFGGGGASGNW